MAARKGQPGKPWYGAVYVKLDATGTRPFPGKLGKRVWSGLAPTRTDALAEARRHLGAYRGQRATARAYRAR